MEDLKDKCGYQIYGNTQEVNQSGAEIYVQKISVVIVGYNNIIYSKKCFSSIVENTDFNNVEIIFVDNGSTDETEEWGRYNDDKFPYFKYIRNEKNLGYAKGNNIGIKNAHGDIVILLNNDTLVTKGWIDKVRSFFSMNQDCIIGPVTNSIGSWQRIELEISEDNYDVVASSYTEKHVNEFLVAERLCFFCVAIPRKVLEKVGMFDENYELGNFEDDDYCVRVKENGYKIYILEDLFIYHFGSKTIKTFNEKVVLDYNKRNRAYFEKKNNIKINNIDIIEEYFNMMEIYFNNFSNNKYSSEVMNMRHVMFNNLIDRLRRERFQIQNEEERTFLKKLDDYLFKGKVRFYSHRLREGTRNIRNIRGYGFRYFFYGLKRILYPYKFEDKILEDKKNLYNIPVFIVSYNRLECLKRLLSWLQKNKFSNIIIVDNNSSYPPLLKFLDEVECSVVHLSHNHGHLAVWNCKKFDKILQGQPYIVTDCDIVPDDGCPNDCLEHFYSFLKEYKKITKVGFSLRIDDIPDYYINKSSVIKWEDRFWKLFYEDSKFYDAPIDTTFALYRPGIYPYSSKSKENPLWWKAVRSRPPYVARHAPWYEDTNNLNEETKYYIEHIQDKQCWWYSPDNIETMLKNGDN